MNSKIAIKWWLLTVATMVFLMVFIGGITRLTDSGLSMVDWKPIMGTLPPTSQIEWEDAFSQYQQFPEFKKINSTMDLEGFKRIYFWEYFHRLFGRLIGLAFFFPFVFFLWKKALNKKQIRKYSIAFILGGLQGLLGWYMVKSGLVDRPDVSHYRLAAHLSLAFSIIAYLYWLVLELKHPARKFVKGSPLFVLFLVLLGLQIVYGAFVAGLDAGLTHNTFPKMGRNWIPTELFMLTPTILNFFENPVGIQFFHRYLGYAVFSLGVFLWFRFKKAASKGVRDSINILFVMLFIQLCLGIGTLVWFVPVWTASLHQLGACILLLLTMRCLFFSFTKPLDMT